MTGLGIFSTAYAATCGPAPSPGNANPNWQTFCWMDMSNYNNATVFGGGQNFSITLSDGSLFTFTLSGCGIYIADHRLCPNVACINASPTGSKLSGITSIPINFTILAGDVISCVITNTDNVTVTNVQVKDQHGSPAVLVPLGAAGITSETLTTSDPLGAAASLPEAVAGDGIWSKLAPGASVTFTWAHVVTQAEVDHG